MPYQNAQEALRAIKAKGAIAAAKTKPIRPIAKGVRPAASGGLLGRSAARSLGQLTPRPSGLASKLPVKKLASPLPKKKVGM